MAIEESRVSIPCPNSIRPINTAPLAHYFEYELELAPSRGLVHGIMIAMVFWTILLAAVMLYLFL
jgi:hypothetical protein